MTLRTEHITGLVLCGGRGSRMGGADKGLLPHQGRPLALHALQRLAPQVGKVALNANRNLPDYEALGAPVWPDALADHPGPLAGWLAGLTQCDTPYLATVACDTPQFPADLVARLAQALHLQGADIAMASTLEDGQPQRQPVFCLLRCSLADSLAQYLQRGDRQVHRWASQHHCVHVMFDDSAAFFNVNTQDDLQRLADSR